MTECAIFSDGRFIGTPIANVPFGAYHGQAERQYGQNRPSTRSSPNGWFWRHLAVRDGERGTLAASIDARRGRGAAVAIPDPIGTRAAVLAARAGDVLFSCVETLEVYIIDFIASAYSISASAYWRHAHDMSFDEHST